MSQKDTFSKASKGRNNRNRGGAQPQQQQKRQNNAGNTRPLDPKDQSQKGQTSYVPKATAPVQPSNGSVPVAPVPRPTQGTTPFLANNGAPRPVHVAGAVPPRVQSAPPNLTEQQQAGPNFLPHKTFNPPPAHAAPPHLSHLPTGVHSHGPIYPHAGATNTVNAPGAAAGTPSTLPAGGQHQISSTSQGPAQLHQSQTQPPAQAPSTPQSTPPTQSPPHSQLPLQAHAHAHPQPQPHSQPQSQSQVLPQQQPPQPQSAQPQAQMPTQPYKQQPYYSQPYYGYPGPNVHQYQMPSIPMQPSQQQQGQPPQRGMTNMPHTGYPMPLQTTRHQGPLSHPTGQPLSHGVPITTPLGAQSVSISAPHVPMNASLVGHVPMNPMGRSPMPYPRPPYPSATPQPRGLPAGVVVPPHHTAPVGHTMPVPITPARPRQSHRIAIINPATGREIGSSPPKDGAVKSPSTRPDETADVSSDASAATPDFHPPGPSKAVTIQAPPPGTQKPPFAKRAEGTSPSSSGNVLEGSSPTEHRASEPSQEVPPEKQGSTDQEHVKEQEKKLREEKEKQESQEKEKQESQEKERQERELKERIAKEQLEREEKERVEKEAKERIEKEAKELAEKDAKERTEREEKERLELEKHETELAEKEKQKQEEAEQKALEAAKEKLEPLAGEQDTTRPVITAKTEESPVLEKERKPTQSKELRAPPGLEVDRTKEEAGGTKQKPKSRKEILKNADAGQFEAAHFDAYGEPVKRSESDAQSNTPYTESAARSNGTSSSHQVPAEEAEDDWESNADEDWEAKAEDELVLQKDSKDISLRPNFGATGAFRSTLSSAKPEGFYNDGSWSPHNTSGKKMYGRDFLLKFQPYCREKPAGLPLSEVILGYDDKKGGPSPKGKGAGAAPTWLKSPGSSPFNQRGARGATSAGGRFTTSFRGQRGAPTARGGGSGRGRGLGKKGPKDEPLVEIPPPSEKVWVRPNRRQQTDPHAETYGKIRNILNKLTEEKFAPLSKQMVDLLKEEAKDMEILKGVIDLLFQKALLEPGFCTMYAELCRVLERSIPPCETPGVEGKPQTFKRFLLNKCQEEFEQKPQEDKDKDVTDPKLKAELDAKRKDRMIGNIVFIGELYKEKMLTDKIVHECVFKRLLGDIENPAEEDLEALCKLMLTIGKVLDTAKAQRYMDAYFKRMKQLYQNQKIASRVRYLLRDVIELRQRGWDEKKAVDPSRTAARSTSRPTAIATRRPPASSAQQQGSQGGRGGSGRQNAPSAGGWETVGGSKSRHEPVPKTQPMVLGPNSQTGGPSMGSGGAKGWQAVPEKPQQGKRPAAEPGPGRNMFSALAQERSPMSDRKQLGDKDEPRDREPGRSPRGTSKDKFEKREEEDEEVKEEREESVGKSEVSWKQVEESSRLLLLEFLDSHDTGEALECLQELGAPQFHSNIIKLALVEALRLKEDKARDLMMKLFKVLFDEGLVSEQQFEQGFKDLFDEFEGIAEDAPKAPLIIGACVGSAVLDGYVKLSNLPQMLSSLIAPNIAEKVVAGAFTNIIESTSIEDLKDMYKTANLNIMDFFRPANRTEERLAQWQEKFNMPRLSEARQYGPELKEMIQRGDAVDTIIEWIEKNLESEIWTDGDVAFATSLCRYILDYVASQTVKAPAGTFDSDEKVVAEEKRLLTLYGPLLSKFVSNYTGTQLQCLFAVQHFCFGLRFPKGLMEVIFHSFYMQEVILEEVYRAWVADDTSDTPGKRQALAEVGTWLNWLDNAQKEEGDESDNGKDESQPSDSKAV